jgi:hypothetical protein
MEYAPMRETPFSVNNGRPVWGQNWSKWFLNLKTIVSELQNNVQSLIANSPQPEAVEEYPVGSVFTAVVSTDPQVLKGYGTWAAIASNVTPTGYSQPIWAWKRTA